MGEIIFNPNGVASLACHGFNVHMKPLSRARPPNEFTLRVPCLLSQQFAISDAANPQSFDLGAVRCTLELIEGAIVVSASGFSTEAAAGECFTALKHRFAKIAIDQRIPAGFPANLERPTVTPFSFIPGDTRCVTHGWPAQPITPLLVPKYCASVYPEHEYVAIEEVIRFTPTFASPLANLAEKLGTSESSPAAKEPLDETLLLASWAYCHAARTTQWVWSILLAVTTLEMLAKQSSASSETQEAVAKLIDYANKEYLGSESVDLEQIRSCLSQAKTISKNKAVRELVRLNCAPGIADSPLTDVFADESDCEKKVRALYAVRSKYTHEGRIKESSKQEYPFEVLHNVALASLRHILQRRLA